MIPISNGAFQLERLFRASPSRVYAAFADPVQKRRWFGDTDDFRTLRFELNVCTGGRDHYCFQFRDMPEVFNEQVYLDVQENRRLVYAYVMGTEAGIFSASHATITFAPEGEGCRLLLLEQVTFFEGGDGLAGREEGTRQLLDALAGVLGEG